jgi:hypothetical protein
MDYFKGSDSFYHAQETADYCAPAAAFSILSDPDVGFNLQGARQSVLFQAGKSNQVLWAVDPPGMKTILNQFKGGFSKDFDVLASQREADATAQIVGQLSSGIGVAPATLVWGTAHWVSVNGVITDGDPAGNNYKLLKVWLYDPFSPSAPSQSHANPDDCERLGIKEYFIFYPMGWRQMMSGFFVGRARAFVVLGVRGLSAATNPGIVPPAGVSIVIDPRTHQVVPTSVPSLWDSWLRIYGSWPKGSLAANLLNGSQASTSVRVRRIDVDTTWYLFPILKDGQFVGTGMIDANSGAPVSVLVHAPGSPWRGYVERLAKDMVDSELVWLPCAESMTPHFPFRQSLEEGVTTYERLDGQHFEELSFDQQGR